MAQQAVSASITLSEEEVAPRRASLLDRSTFRARTRAITVATRSTEENVRRSVSTIVAVCLMVRRLDHYRTAISVANTAVRRMDHYRTAINVVRRRRAHVRTAVHRRREVGPTEAKRRRGKNPSLSVHTHSLRPSIIATGRIMGASTSNIVLQMAQGTPSSNVVLQKACPRLKIELYRMIAAAIEDSAYVIAWEAACQLASRLTLMVVPGGALRAIPRLKA